MQQSVGSLSKLFFAYGLMSVPKVAGVVMWYLVTR